MAYMRVGFMGLALTVHFGPDDVDDDEPAGTPAGIGGGSGGNFELLQDMPLEYFEPDGYEDFGFGA